MVTASKVVEKHARELVLGEEGGHRNYIKYLALGQDILIDALLEKSSFLITVIYIFIMELDAEEVKVVEFFVGKGKRVCGGSRSVDEGETVDLEMAYLLGGLELVKLEEAIASISERIGEKQAEVRRKEVISAFTSKQEKP